MNSKKVFFYYVQGYLIELPATFIHELSHYLVTFIFFLLGMCDFPTMHFTKRFECIMTSPGCTSTNSWYAHVKFRGPDTCRWRLLIINAAPAFTTIALFIFSPWYLYPVYLSCISTLWMSTSDMDVVERLWNGGTIKDVADKEEVGTEIAKQLEIEFK